jgi:hypothetical protein
MMPQGYQPGQDSSRMPSHQQPRSSSDNNRQHANITVDYGDDDDDDNYSQLDFMN